MAKTTVQSKPTRSLKDGPLLIGGATAALLLITLWYFSNPWHDFSKNPTNPYWLPTGSQPPPAQPAHHPPMTSSTTRPTQRFTTTQVSVTRSSPMENWDEKRREWLKDPPQFRRRRPDTPPHRLTALPLLKPYRGPSVTETVQE